MQKDKRKVTTSPIKNPALRIDRKERQQMKILDENHYAEEMQNKVLPRLEAHKHTGTFERVKGQPLYYEIYDADNKNAQTLVILHGFAEAIPKFYETAYYFLQLGYRVALLQQREHGYSYRSVNDPFLVNIENYADLIDDLHTFVHEILQGAPTFLFAHSMGGAVAAAYLERYPDDFQKAILSSPMLDINSGKIPLPLALAYGHFMIRHGLGRKYWTGEPEVEPYAPQDALTNSLPRYDYWYQKMCKEESYQTRGLSLSNAMQFLKLTHEIGNSRNCRRVKTPVLLFQTEADSMVLPKGQIHFIHELEKNDSPSKYSRLVLIKNAKHELYRCNNAILKKYWTEIEKFSA